MSSSRTHAERAELTGHAHIPLEGERQTGRTDPDEDIAVTLLLRRRRELPDIHEHLGHLLPEEKKQKHMTQLGLSERHGATSESFAAVERFAKEHKLKIVAHTNSHRAITLNGSSATIEKAFGVRLVEMEQNHRRYRVPEGRLSVPRELSETVQAVVGLSTRPFAKRVAVHHKGAHLPFWTVQQMAEAYGFAPQRSAKSRRIALIELGGGYHEEDLRQYFTSAGVPMPKLRCVSVDGAQNLPAPKSHIKLLLDAVEGKCEFSEIPQDALSSAQCTIEVTMDIELAGALAPGAEIIVYMAPATEHGILSALHKAIANDHELPDAISISWGEPEIGVSEAIRNSIEETLREAALLGVTVCASSGDEGALNGSSDGTPTVNFPASSPHVLSCGGTSVEKVGTGVREAVWNCSQHGIRGASGGGVSRYFSTPKWQHDHGVPLAPTGMKGRGVPDVAGPADPHRGCAILVGGEWCSSAGTSAVAPLWAALVACLNSELGTRCGYITPLLYRFSRTEKSSLREITEGDNGFYQARRGWNACTGLGSPEATHLASALRGKPGKIHSKAS
jgi:kumamolisin